MPKVSVLMPAFEPKKEHICEAVGSVFHQSMTDWKLHIQDDCSVREDTKSHIAQFLNDPRISFAKNDTNLGIGPNWNECLKFVDSEYIAFLFHDDMWEPAYLEKMTAVLDENEDIGFVSAMHSYMKEDANIDTQKYDELKKMIKEKICPGKHLGHKLIMEWAEMGLSPNIIGEPSFVVLRKKLINKVGLFHETMPQFLDSEYWIRCLLKTNWYYLDENLGTFRLHNQAASAKNEEKGLGKFDRFECFQMLIKKAPKENRAKLKLYFQNAFDGMIKKFAERKKENKNISVKGSGTLKKFLIRHPIFVCKAIWRHKKNKKWNKVFFIF